MKTKVKGVYRVRVYDQRYLLEKAAHELFALLEGEQKIEDLQEAFKIGDYEIEFDGVLPSIYRPRDNETVDVCDGQIVLRVERAFTTWGAGGGSAEASLCGDEVSPCLHHTQSIPTDSSVVYAFQYIEEEIFPRLAWVGLDILSCRFKRSGMRAEHLSKGFVPHSFNVATDGTYILKPADQKTLDGLVKKPR